MIRKYNGVVTRMFKTNKYSSANKVLIKQNIRINQVNYFLIIFRKLYSIKNKFTWRGW